jgi:hypothetical protein
MKIYQLDLCSVLEDLLLISSVFVVYNTSCNAYSLNDSLVYRVRFVIDLKTIDARVEILTSSYLLEVLGSFKTRGLVLS